MLGKEQLNTLQDKHFYFAEVSTAAFRAVIGWHHINSDVDEIKEHLIKLEFPVF